MKTLLLTLLLAFPTDESTNRTVGPTLRPALNQLRSARTTDQWLTAARQMGRLSDQSPSDWLTAYWTAYAYIALSFRKQDEADGLLDQAEPYLDRATRLQPGHDEILVLQSYMAQARLAVRPMFRWMKYGSKSDEALQAARQKNAANPRILLLEGMALYHKPASFGGGPKTACPLFRQSAEKFAIFKPASDLHPDWGKRDLERVLAQCGK